MAFFSFHQALSKLPATVINPPTISILPYPRLVLPGNSTSSEQHDPSSTCPSAGALGPPNPHRTQQTVGNTGCLCHICQWSFLTESPEQELVGGSAPWDLAFARYKISDERGIAVEVTRTVDAVVVTRTVDAVVVRRLIPKSPLRTVQNSSDIPDMLDVTEEEDEEDEETWLPMKES